MIRGLPYSIVIHTVGLVVVFVYGSHVSAPAIEPQRVFRVRIAQEKALQPTAPEQPPVEAEPSPPVETPRPKPETRPELEPKQVPDLPPEKPKPKPKKPEPKPAVSETIEQPTEPVAQPEPTLAPAGPAVSATDQPFEFAYYLNLIEGRVSRHWNPRQLGFRNSASHTCVVHFMVDRRGNISQVTLSRTSGVALFDREALRAVQAAQPLPPLPPKYTARTLGVSFVFTLESGL